MYCRNCGSSMDTQASFCAKCGVARGIGHRHCSNCGTATAPDAHNCFNCGVVFDTPQQTYYNDQKSKVAAGVLGILVGALGIHNFYLGYTGKGLTQLLLTLFTCGVAAPICGIWGLVEGILILTGSIAVDARGVPLRD